MSSFSSLRTAAALALVLALSLVSMTTTSAQDASPVATPETDTEITAVATGLSAPRGFTWGPDGVLYVAQSGPGSSEAAVGAASSVVKIVDGCPVPAATGLPSTFDPFKDVLGPMDVQFVGPQMYVLQTATGLYGHGSPTPPMPNGIYTAGQDGSVSLWLDLTSYIDAYPPIDMPGDANELAEPYRFLYDGDGFWLIDSNRSLVFFIAMDKSITRVADLSLGHPILAAMTLDGQGGIYVGNLTPAPHADGAAEVVRIDRTGNIQRVWTNLTVLTGLALDSNNQLYALEMATGNGGPDGMRPGTGRLLKQTGVDSYDIVAYGLEFPIDLRIGPDGAFYVSLPAYGENAQSGLILRIPASASNLTVDLSTFDGGMCEGAAPYKAPAAVPPGSPTAAPAGTPVPAATPAG
ncbi:MAG: ScyD/ScyE family protein [Thermomicrobiales bacterium]|nr:ScyD/ScyE family protein [Thermomicrobiales bacterium]